MPFIKRMIEPRYLSNKPLPPGCDRELDTVSNNTLCGLVRQLADLSLRASDIFKDISVDAELLAERTISFRKRVTKLEEIVEKLDARSVRVPVSSLEQFKNTTKHYKASHDYDEDLFVRATRPACIQAIYDAASTDLKDIYDKFKEYHEDEVTVISMRASSLLAAQYKAQSEYNIVFPRRDIILPSPEQKRENLPNPKRTQRPLSEADLLADGYLQRIQSPLPTPEEALRKSVSPSSLVTVDTSGSGFDRMINFRRSLNLPFRRSSRVKKDRKEKKVWRRTIAGIPREVEEELKRERPRSNSGSDCTSTSTSTEFEELRTRSLDRRVKYSVRDFNKAYEASIATSKPGLPNQPNKPGIAVVAPLRNRRRQRSSAEMSRLQQALNLNGSASLPRGLGLLRPASVPPGSAMGTVQFSDGSTDSSMERIWQTAATNRLNEKSESSQPPSSDNHGDNKPKLFLPQMSYLPNAVIPTQAKVMSIPTNATANGGEKTSGPQGLASSVRLRMQKSSLRKEDRRSSSGNWSGTDSTRTSVCSEQDGQVNSLNKPMDASPSDSAVSLSNEADSTQGTPTTPNPITSFPGVKNGDSSRPSFLPIQSSSHSSSSGSPTPTNELDVGGSFTRLDTETWLKSVGVSQNTPPALNPKVELGNTAPPVKAVVGTVRPQLSFCDTDSESSVENGASIVSDNTSLDLDAYFGDSAEEFPDSDSLSAFSVDQEGYWTSMHSDCGLSPKHNKHPTQAEQPQSVGYDYDIAAHYRHKESRKGFITPRNKVQQGDIMQHAPPPPKRVDSVSPDPRLSAPHLQLPKGGSPVSLDSVLSNQTLTIDSDGSRSVTPAPSDMSEVSSASYDLPPPLASPTEPKMYTICFSGSNKSQDNTEGRPPSRQGIAGQLSLASTTASNISSQYTHSMMNGSARLAKNTDVITTAQQQAHQDRAYVTMAQHDPIPSVSSSANPVPSSSQSSTSDFWATPIIPGAMLKARERFYGFKPSHAAGTDINTSTSRTSSGSDTDTVTPVTSPKSPITTSNIFFGLYPGSYNTLKRKSNDNTYTVYSNGMTGSLINKPADVISPTNSLERKQRFNRYVSGLQSQAPQTYDALSQLRYSGDDRGNKAMSREQRAEILDQMRRSKSPSRGGSSMVSTPTTPTTPTLPAVPILTSNSDMAATVTTSVRDDAQEAELQRLASFRNSYHEGIQTGNLDPDMAIIHAARKMEHHLYGPDIGTQEDYDQETDILETIESPEPPTTPKSVTVDTEITSQPQQSPYVFDPNRRPKSSILKATRGSSKEDGSTAGLMAKIHLSKKRMHITTDPFANTPIGKMMAADLTPEHTPSSSGKSIRFSETVTVDHTPVRVCLVSGKPRTNIDDFKALLQQQSPSGNQVSACSALNVKRNVKGPRNAELLYRGSLLEDDGVKSGDDESDSGSSPVPERKIVTVNDLKNAMATAKCNVRTGNLGLPYKEVQAQNRQRSNSPTTGAIVRESSDTIIEEAEVSFTHEVPNMETPLENGDTYRSEMDNSFCHENGSSNSTAVDVNVNSSECSQHINLHNLGDVRVSLSCNNNNNQSDVTCHDPTPDTKTTSPLNTVAHREACRGAAAAATTPPAIYSTSDSSTAVKRPPKHSWSDTDLNRARLMSEIRERGKQADSRDVAVAKLEETQGDDKEQSGAQRSLPVSRSEGSIHSLLHTVKDSIQKMSPKHEAHGSLDMEYPPDAWD